MNKPTATPVRYSNPKDVAASQTLLGYAGDMIRLQMDDFNRLEAKTYYLLVLAGLLAAVNVASIDKAIDSYHKAADVFALGVASVLVFGYAGAGFTLLGALWFSLRVLWLRSAPYPPRPHNAIKQYEEMKHPKRALILVKSLARELALVELELRKCNEQKATDLREATRLTAFTMFFTVVAGVAYAVLRCARP